MTKSLRTLTEWLDSLGYSSHAWLSGDWHQPLHLLSKLLAEDLKERRPTNSKNDVAFKISFDALVQLAEGSLGVPCLITERDLMIQYPNIYLALLFYLVCLKHSLGYVDPQIVRSTVAPRLVFEARNGMDAQFPRCSSCQEHVFFIERIVIESTVWHRQCFKCVNCSQLLRSGGYKKGKLGYECIQHAIRRILNETEPSRLIRPTTAPPPAPSIQEHCSQIKPVIMRDNLVSPKLHISSKPNSILSNVQQKPLPPPKPKGITVDKSRGTVLMDKNDSCDPTTSIIQKMTEATEIGPSPIAPPRPKRASLLLSGGVTSQLSPLKNTSMSRCSSLSSGEMHHIPRLHGIVTVSKIHDKSSQSIKNVIDKYPEDMCPFDQDDEDDFFYDNSKNPFADSDAEEEITLPVSLLPGESDRPKCHPPPPPIITEGATSSDSEKCHTLKISKKTIRAPLPPNIFQKRKIIFTEHSSFEHINNISAKLIRLDGELFKIEREGRKIEVELLFLISQNPNDWLKLPRTEDLLRTVNQFLDVIKEQTVVQFLWWESFLNEIHSETEYMLRCIIEKDAQDEYSVEREKQLTKLLIFIINEKAKLVESGLDFDTGYSDVKKQEKEKSKLKLRMALLSKAKKFKK